MTNWFSWSQPTQRGSAKLVERTTHMYVIGQPGMGKSRAIESWLMQDVAAGHGLGLIDIHGDTYWDTLLRLAVMPEVWDRIVLFDPTNPTWTVRFNPLEPVSGVNPERLALFLTDVIVKVWGIDTTEAPRMVWILKNTFLALADLKLTLLDLPRFLLDGAYQASLLPSLTHPQAKSYFENEYPQNPATAAQWAAPILNKLGGLLFDQDVREILAGPSTLNFHQLMAEKKILLVHLPKGIIGEGASSLLGAFIVAHLQKAALARAATSNRPQFYLYLDEFQNYTTDNIKDILSESRKYALSLTLAHQYLEQLAPDMQAAVLNTAGTIVSFRVGYQDAIRLAKDIFPRSDYLAKRQTQVRVAHWRGMPKVFVREQTENQNWDDLAVLLANLPKRQFWCRQRSTTTPALHKSFSMPTPQLTEELKRQVQELVDYCGQRFGTHKGQLPPAYTGFSGDGSCRVDDNIPIWGN